MVCNFANCIILGFYEEYSSESRKNSYLGEKPHEENNYIEILYLLDKVNMAFTFVFVLEAVLKIVSHGLVFHKKSFFRESFWNWIDMAVVIFG